MSVLPIHVTVCIDITLCVHLPDYFGCPELFPSAFLKLFLHYLQSIARHSNFS